MIVPAFLLGFAQAARDFGIYVIEAVDSASWKTRSEDLGRLVQRQKHRVSAHGNQWVRDVPLPSLRSRQTAKGRHSHATNVESTFRSCAEGRLTTSTPGKKCDDSQQLAPTNSSTLRYRLGMTMAILIARQVDIVPDRLPCHSVVATPTIPWST
jgi:hypothetical protein